MGSREGRRVRVYTQGKKRNGVVNFGIKTVESSEQDRSIDFKLCRSDPFCLYCLTASLQPLDLLRYSPRRIMVDEHLQNRAWTGSWTQQEQMHYQCSACFFKRDREGQSRGPELSFGGLLTLD